MSFQNVLYVGAAGFCGTILRYLLALSVNAFTSSRFGIATLLVNIIGSFAIGWVHSVGTTRFDQQWITILTVGLMGGFTTFSAFSAESILFLKEGRVAWALVYIFIMLTSCLAATYLGFLSGK